MPRSVYLHIIALLIGVLLTFFWVNIPALNQFSLQLTGLLLLSLLLGHRLLNPSRYKLAESVISTIAVILVVSSTGNLTSPLFFLNFILLFELSLILEPVIPIIVSLTLIPVYLYSTDSSVSSIIYVALFSFPLITPLAYFTGLLYQKVKNQKKEINNLSEKVEELKEELIEEELNHNL